MGTALDLIVRASEDVENIAVHLLGPPNKALSNQHQLRWGDSGRLCLNLTGQHAGKWRRWGDDVGGDALDLVEQELNLSRAEALGWLDRWFGGSVEAVDHSARHQRQQEAAADHERAARFKRAVAADIWNSAVTFAGSPAEQYMLRTRFPGWSLPDAVYRSGALRWNSDETVPGAIGAMVALMTDPVTRESRGVHRTYIGADAERLGRKMLGNWGVVRLWADAEVTQGLSIGEGIESTIAGVLLTGRAPAWATLDAGGVKAFPVLGGIGCLSIFVDNDASGTGQKAADACASRWHDAGREPVLFEPQRSGEDFNNILQGQTAA